VEIPDLINNMIVLLAKMSTPLCMLIMGMRLACASLKKVFLVPSQYLIVLIKQVAFPLVAFLILLPFPLADEMKSSGGWGWNTVNSVLGVGALGSALGIGIPAITKAFSKDKCNGWGNGYGYGHGFGYGFGGCGCSENTVVNRFELGQSQRISELESARDTDAKILEAYKALASSDQRQDEKFAQLTKSLTDYVIANNREVDHRFAQLDKESALNTQEIRDNLRFLDYKIDSNQKEMFAYVDCKTIPLQKKIGINSICPTPLAASTPLTANAQVLATTPADTTGEVALNTVRVAK
jgi:hypothetical protein